MTIQYIPLNDLVPSARNVRKVKADVTGLALSLAAEGLIQNLVVSPREDGKFEVVAGERRRRAIVQLVKAGTWERDIEIPCEVRDPEAATTISYAENAQRVAMHPADAIRAFGTMAAEGHSEEAIAHRYGYDSREVRKMLALASISPKVINALAADKIDLACAQAFTLTDDHKRQERVLKRARTAHEVRSLLTESKVTTGHRLFRFIGMDAYEQAGGTITGDLFSKDSEGYANDAELVQRLVDEKLDRLTSEAEAEGWGEVIAAEQTPYESYNWHRVYADQKVQRMTEADEAALAELQAKREARLAVLAEDGEQDEDFEPEWDDEVAEIDAEIEKIGEVERSYSAEVKAGALLLIVIDHQGQTTTTAYTRKAQRSVARASDGSALPRPLYDARMTEELSRMRTAALQSEVAKNQRLAFAVLLDALLPILTSAFASPHAVQLRAGTGIQEPTQHFDYNTREMGSPFEGVADLIGSVPETAEARFQWVLALDDDAVARMLAACSGALIDARQGKYAEKERLQSADRIARAANLDMREHWEGGVEFFGAISKKAMMAALTEACGPQAAENCAKLRKQDLALACADRIPGRGWLPPALLTPEAPVAEVEADEAGTDDETERYEAENDDMAYQVAAE
ncbi:ParB/RepB/Spo0J family partition protein [Sphingobium indicum]